MQQNIIDYFHTKDQCRRGLLKYLENALSILPKVENPNILDVGCGTGIPTFLIMEKLGGELTAVDIDQNAILYFKEKLNKTEFLNRIKIQNKSIFDLTVDLKFDFVFAEGFLNVVGFKKGIKRLLQLTKKNGYIIIHDEFQNREKKIHFFRKNGCEVTDSFVIDAIKWWDGYYKCLEDAISKYSEKDMLKLFRSDILEIEAYKKNPTIFKSVYFIVKKK